MNETPQRPFGPLFLRVELKRDKEFHFQDWFENRLNNLGLAFDPPARITYPDFRFIEVPLGFEVKGLGFPGREANFDSNSQVPTGLHNKRTIYYVFGRYPSEDVGNELAVYDLILCHGDFLNADHEYSHKNKNIKGFGSYGDIMIRDRKMYVCPTPYVITTGTQRQVTLIMPEDVKVEDVELANVGELVRTECEEIIVGYSFNLKNNDLNPVKEANPRQAKVHRFIAYKLVEFEKISVGMTK